MLYARRSGGGNSNDGWKKDGWDRAAELEKENERLTEQVRLLRAKKGVADNHPKEKGVVATAKDKRSRVDLAKHGGGQITAGFIVMGWYELLAEAGWPMMRQSTWEGEFVNTCLMGIFGWMLAIVYKIRSQFD